MIMRNISSVYGEAADSCAASERDRLIVDHLYLVKFVARRVMDRHYPPVELDDLISAGTLGLLDAVEKFCPENGVQFSTYAEHRIRGSILDFIRKWSWAPRKVYKKAKDFEKAVLELEGELGRAPDDGEIADKLGISLEEYHEAVGQFAGIKVVPLEETIAPDLGPTAELNGVPSPDALEMIEDKELKRKLALSIADLPEKEKMVVALYYQEELTFREIAEVLEVTESRVCQIHSQAVIRLRSKMRPFIES